MRLGHQRSVVEVATGRYTGSWKLRGAITGVVVSWSTACPRVTGSTWQ
jgi:hypothetical protein